MIIIQIIFNSNGKWCPNGGIGPSYPTSKICPFYKSTGVSNPSSVNFPNMWFPFFRIKTSQEKQGSNIPKGWIYKAWGLQSVKQLRERLTERFQIPAPTFPETSDFLYCFLEKFSHWWQIQLSLQLPIDEGTMWSTNDILKKMKDIVLNYDYDHFGGDYKCFIKNTNTPEKYILETDPKFSCDEKHSNLIQINNLLRNYYGTPNTLPIEDTEDE